jgi:hypothetical protein
MIAEKVKKPTWNPEYIRDVSEKIYRASLEGDDLQKMLEKDADGGVKLRGRAVCYDKLTRLYLDELGVKPPVL